LILLLDSGFRKSGSEFGRSEGDKANRLGNEAVSSSIEAFLGIKFTKLNQRVRMKLSEGEEVVRDGRGGLVSGDKDSGTIGDLGHESVNNFYGKVLVIVKLKGDDEKNYN